MKRTAIGCLVALLAGCSVNDSPEGARQVLQPVVLPSMPQHLGRQAGALLGTSVAACPGPGFVAGAPGENATLLFTNSPTWYSAPFTPDGGHGVGNAVACLGVPPSLVVTAGNRGMWSLPAGVLNSAGSVQTLERGSGLAASALLVGKPATGTVEIFTSAVGTFLPSISPPSTTTGAGSAFVWDPLGTFFVVGDPVAGSAQFYGWTAGIPTLGPVLPGPPSSSGFGAALAIGDVHPNPGRELIVGAPWSGQVFIYTLPPSSLLMVLDGPDTTSVGSFGTALAVEPASVVTNGNLQALWVGDPANARLMRFIGDGGETLSSQTNSYFGFSLAVSEQKLIVGAPFFTEAETSQGAVYSFPFGTQPIQNSEPQACFTGGCVTSDCHLGRCVGGVICRSTLNLSCVGGTCNNGNCTFPDGGGRPDAGDADAGDADAGDADAGESDAGEADAGEPDAGQPDAGEPDAGEPDAGEPDAGEPDAGEPDAGEPDAGEPDAGEPDAGPSDAGKAGEPKDAGTDIEVFGTSCGCSGGGAGVIPLWLLSLLWSRRRMSVGLPSPRPSPPRGEGAR